MSPASNAKSGARWSIDEWRGDKWHVIGALGHTWNEEEMLGYLKSHLSYQPLTLEDQGQWYVELVDNGIIVLVSVSKHDTYRHRFFRVTQ